ncbi:MULTISPECIES: hypothetical protein [unclassified Pseudoxanthomonas]|uniref:hypothetical protein n=1 Tax=unclassified Pseudoxanthomonas TaxID=2645906 RepID=UPI0008EE5C3C|nr:MULTISPECIES: hypothetical protein [unclassified Pseudoxanthomonas]PPJ40905.1 hypothetical protein C0063_13460 [Pseudoxanthomonas sp. KAs_5_3]SFV31810.1 hypothetical protein SAMN05428990_2214 [Pseudoxanthomonas sp. YR558]
MKQNRISYALAAALVGTVALVGCKKKEEPVAAPPAVTEPAPAPAPVEPAPAPVSATSVTVGNTAAADKSVAAVSTFGTKDKIIVSVKTDASTPADAAIDAKLTFQDGQVAGQQTANVKAEDAGTTNVEFSNTNPWPAGKYKVDVTLNGQPVGMTQEIEVK